MGTEAVMPDNGMIERPSRRVRRQVLGSTFYTHAGQKIVLSGFSAA